MPDNQSAFLDSKSNLNPAQLRAVEQTEGPVMVLAGPGTGKTQVLATRIGEILNETGMDASNILCLTFSNAGVASMENRLQKLLGKTGELIEVHTYHSLAQQIIIDTNHTRVEKSQLITDVQRYMILEKLFSDQSIAGKYHDVKPTNITKLTSMARLFGLFKQEGISPSQLKEIANEAIRTLLPSDSNYINNDGTINAEGKKIELQIQEFTAAAAPMYEAYLKIIKEKNKLEYDDLLIKAIEILNEDENTLLFYQEKYQYILVDEFQDTNSKQLQLLNLLIKNVEQPNIFIVGDDDQCIYKFQGASAENFDHIQNILPDMQTVLLNQNYRSTKALLNHAFRVISENNNRHPLKTNPLEAALEHQSEQLPTICEYSNEEEEAYDLVTNIDDLLKVDYQNKSIAILYRKNKEAELIKKWLHYFEIPYTINKSKNDLMGTDFGKRLYAILQFIRLYQKDNNVALMHFNRLLMEMSLTHSMLYCSLTYKELQAKNISYFDWLKKETKNEWNKDVLEVFEVLIQLCEEADQTLNAAITDQILELACTNLEISESLHLAWAAFLEEFQQTSKPATACSLANLLLYHKIYEIPVEYREVEQVTSGVILSTIHSSKGLEFDVVFLKGCNSKNWEESIIGGGITVPKVLNQVIRQDSNNMEDLRRLFYVGMTRAKTRLHISYTIDKTQKKPGSHTALLAPFFERKEIETEIEKEFIQFCNLPKRSGSLMKIVAAEPLLSLIQNRKNQFAISASSTYNWLNCQQKFFFVNICKIQDDGNEAMSYGSMVHETLEEISANTDIQHNQTAIDNLVERVFLNFKYQFHPLHEMAYKQAAKNVVAKYLKELPFAKTPDEVEKYLLVTKENGIKLSGVIDRLEFNGNTASIIDYKTGRYYPSKEIFISHEEPGSGYWRQGMMYHLLIEGIYGKQYEIDFSFHYVEEESNKVKSFSYTPNPAYEAWLKEMWDRIQDLSFTKSCDDDECLYCREQLG